MAGGDEVFYDADEEPQLLPDAGVAAKRDAYALHRAAFNNDVVQLAGLLNDLHQSLYTQLDPHGNNALHVAALRGNSEAVQLLLDAGLPAASRSSRGWTALDEALAAHALPAARLLQRQMLTDIKSEMKAKRTQLLESMRQMPDYSLQLKWQLGSSVPGLGMLLRRYAPHDTYTIWKVGDRLRVDGSLMGLDTKNIMPEWKRGHFSLVVDGSPAGLAAAAEATSAAVAAASAAAEERERQREAAAEQMRRAIGVAQPQQSQEQLQEQSPKQLLEQQKQAGAAAASSGSSTQQPQQQATSSEPAASTSKQQYQQQQHQPQQQQQDDDEFFDAVDASSAAAGGSSAAGAAGSAGGGPRLLFLNHVKGWWMDLSADKKALKLEGKGEQEELELELAVAMERDVDKVRLKPRNFSFAPVRGWLGGSLTERVEGWRCVVYEATGKLLAVNTSKAHLALPAGASFEEYLSAHYEADAVTETLIDPMSPSGIGAMGGSSKGKGSSGAAAAGDEEADELQQGDADFDGLVWGSESNRNSSSKKGSSSSKKKKGSSGSGAGGPGSGSGAADDSSSSSSSQGRLLRARCWMAQDFPMQLSELLPLLDVIGTANKHMAKVGKFLAKYSQMEMFPIKLQVPLLLTVHVLVSFKAFTPLTPGGPHQPPGEDFFTVPAAYKRRLLQDAMEKSAAGFACNHRDADEYEMDLDLLAPAVRASNPADAAEEEAAEAAEAEAAAGGAPQRRRGSQQHTMLLRGDGSDGGDEELLVWMDSGKLSGVSDEGSRRGLAGGGGSDAGSEGPSERGTVDATRALERAAAGVEQQMLAEVPDESTAGSSVSGSVAAAGQSSARAAAAAAPGGGGAGYRVGSGLDADARSYQLQQEQQQEKSKKSKGLKRLRRRKQSK